MNFVEEGLQVNSGEASPFLKLSEIRKYSITVAALNV